ncbi:uncharacterized protein BX664DRAFT_336611 [Halteromyces radiatus]|uniref:uncharacterized protein n=1 Tax=Halteromyces radiatus TaxID=101107 RepID=UPI0022209B13|nr:uncharacterized protein BX664DRAFT_336611 [Halteromyces radiatus]KAI8086722.1 hypothetical protein BX664DRAFT_336611 [Halteromyces radiatus]
MPVTDIPGYFYDQNKKRYFKIMPSGPYSLASINQAKRKSEKIQLQQKKDNIRQNKRQHLCVNTSSILTFYRQRAIQASLPARSMIKYATTSAYTQLTPQGQVDLSLLENNHRATCTNMVVSNSSSSSSSQCGSDILIGYKGGSIVRYGFQVTPYFQAWKTSQAWQTDSDITSLHFGQSTHDAFQPVLGTSMGQGSTRPNQLWRYSLPLTPPLTNDNVDRIEFNNNNISSYQSVIDPLLLPEPRWDCSFVRRKDTFWTSFITDDIILVGGERHMFILSSSFDFISQIPSPSAVFATQLSQHQPRVAWMGCRNGRILLVDNRIQHKSPQQKYRLDSAVTHLKPLEDVSSGHSILAAGMNGSISLWDTRKHSPLRRFYGHSNEHTRQLAFDVHSDLHLLAMSGDDNKVRLWSLLDQQSEVQPFWTSCAFSDNVCQASILSRPPPLSSVFLNHLDLNKQAMPGLLVCTGTPSLSWLSIL